MIGLVGGRMGQLDSPYHCLHLLHRPSLCENGPLELCHYLMLQPSQNSSTIVPWLLWLNLAILIWVSIVPVIVESPFKSIKIYWTQFYTALICMLKSMRPRIIGAKLVTGNAEIVSWCSTSTCSSRPFNGKSETGLVKALPTCFTFLGCHIAIFTLPLTFGLMVSSTWYKWVASNMSVTSWGGPGLLEARPLMSISSSESGPIGTESFEIWTCFPLTHLCPSLGWESNHHFIEHFKKFKWKFIWYIPLAHLLHYVWPINTLHTHSTHSSNMSMTLLHLLCAQSQRLHSLCFQHPKFQSVHKTDSILMHSLKHCSASGKPFNSRDSELDTIKHKKNSVWKSELQISDGSQHLCCSSYSDHATVGLLQI